ncbi:hypothetical protein HDU82_001315 [Entophlyctis luteolus]|nr:hypothetical protein HDU82_001315 [Entophlyctis luteolus]
MGGMYGADMQDSFAQASGQPTIDSSQDVVLISAPSPSNTSTVYVFYRPVRTCDPMDYDVTQGVHHHMIWAFGASSTTQMYHGTTNRGNTIITLWELQANSSLSEENFLAMAEVSQLDAASQLQVFDIRFPNFTIPSQLTSYYCTHVKVPADQKYHIVQYEAIIVNPDLKENSLVHHIVLYGCSQEPASFNDIFACASMDTACSKFSLAWAPGAGLTIYPPNAGFAIVRFLQFFALTVRMKGLGTNAIQYFALQIHYNNQNALSGVVDSSGLRLYYTDHLRPNDIGILTIGTETINSPGSSLSYTATEPNVCPSSCTKKFPGQLNIISNAFHMHTLGYNISTRIIRNGNETVPLGVRNFYNF